LERDGGEWLAVCCDRLTPLPTE